MGAEDTCLTAAGDTCWTTAAAACLRNRATSADATSYQRLIPDCKEHFNSSAAPSRLSTAPISHWTTVRFCNGHPGRAARSMSQGLRVLVLPLHSLLARRTGS